MSTRVTLTLAILLLAVGLFAWYDLGRDDPTNGVGSAAPPPVQTAKAAKPLVEFEPDAVDAIQLRRGALYLQIRRNEAGWSGVSRPDLIDDFLISMRDAVEIMQLPEPSESRSEYGLDNPTGSIELLLRDGPPVVVLIGDRNPSGTGNYVQVGRAGPVVLAGALIRWDFDKVIRSTLQSSPRQGEEDSH